MTSNKGSGEEASLIPGGCINTIIMNHDEQQQQQQQQQQEGQLRQDNIISTLLNYTSTTRTCNYDYNINEATHSRAASDDDQASSSIAINNNADSAKASYSNSSSNSNSNNKNDGSVLQGGIIIRRPNETSARNQQKVIKSEIQKHQVVTANAKALDCINDDLEIIYTVSSTEDSSIIASKKIINSNAKAIYNSNLDDADHDHDARSAQQITPTAVTLDLIDITPLHQQRNRLMANTPPSAPQAKLITLDDSGLDLAKMAFSLQPNILTHENDYYAIHHHNTQSCASASASASAQYGQGHAIHNLPFLDRTYSSQHDKEEEEPHPNTRPVQTPSCNSMRNAAPYDNVMVESDTTIFSLPSDVLHAIATFTTVDEWRNFGIINRDASLTCREVFRKVKMHSFNCAIEVVTTWVSANLVSDAYSQIDALNYLMHWTI